MPRYAVFETQKVKVVYYVDADSPEQAFDLVGTMTWDGYDDIEEFLSAKSHMQDILVETENGKWVSMEDTK